MYGKNSVHPFNLLHETSMLTDCFALARPTAEVLSWIEELLYLINSKSNLLGDGRDLAKISSDLGLDQASLTTVVARTPQKTALKVFRLIYPTVANRAACVSISRMSQIQLKNIYRQFFFSFHCTFFFL